MRGSPLLLALLFCLLCNGAEAKRLKVSRDSIRIKSPAIILLGNKEMVISRDTTLCLPDSVELVILGKNKKIKRKYKKSVIIKHLNAWIFAGKPDTSQINISRQEYLNIFAGKTVRHITIRNVNVFGGDVAHSKPDSVLTLLERTGNRIHKNTRNRTLRNSLNITSGQKIEPYELSEKEVIIRNLPYIADVMIIPIMVPRTDSIDLYVAVQDVWSLGFHWEPYTASKGFVEVYDENAFGYGHEAVIRTRYSSERSPATGFEAYYTINNIGPEIVKIKFGAARYFDLRNLIFDVQKDYYFKSNYAYGLTLQKYRDIIPLYHKKEPSLFDENLNEIWVGQGFPLYCLHQFDITKPHLYVAARISNTQLHGNQQVSAVENPMFQNKTVYLGSIAIAKQWYNQTKLLLGYGRTEDIPSGYKVELVGGIEKGAYDTRPYAALKTSRGGIFEAGYLSAYAEAGSYVKSDSLQQGSIKAGMFYYSNLLRLGLYRFRQLVSIDYTHGFNRLKGFGESLYLDDNNGSYNGIRGYVGDSVTAQSRIGLHLETIAYSPRTIWNFKLAFFGYSDFAWLSASNSNPFKGPIYNGFGFGVRIRNENLAFKTFTIRLGFYPRVPRGGATDFFDMSGTDRLQLSGFKPSKPDFVPFQNPR